MDILNKYGLQLVKDKKPFYMVTKPSILNSYFYWYFITVGFCYLKDELLPELENAITGKEFDPESGNDIVFLDIGRELCTFEPLNLAKPKATIPTADFKELITIYTNWITSNGLDENIS